MTIDAAARVPVGRTRLAVTRVALGTAPLGGMFEPVAERAALETVERAWDLGIRFFDTAPVYGHGLSEQRLGRILASGRRNDFVLATKVGRLLRADAPPDKTQMPAGEYIWKDVPPVGVVFDFSFDGIMRSFEESLERLGLNRIDVVHIHDPVEHYDQALSGGYRALDRLRREGVIGAVGAGMNEVEIPARFAREADFDCFLIAGRYTLLDQVAAKELFPLCEERQIAVFLGGVFNSGILANPEPGAMYDYAPAPPRLLERAQRLRAVCERHGVPLRAAALQFSVAHPAVTSLLIGPRSVPELEENLELLRLSIPGDVWDDMVREGLLPEGVRVPAEAAAR